MSLRGRNAPVGSEPSAASGRGSEVSEWPRSKFPASAVRQRKNFGHRNRDIRIPRPPSHGKAVTGGFFFPPHRQGTRALPHKVLRYRAGRTGSSAPTNRSVGADAHIGPPHRTPCKKSCHCEGSANTGRGNPYFPFYPPGITSLSPPDSTHTGDTAAPAAPAAPSPPGAGWSRWRGTDSAPPAVSAAPPPGAPRPRGSRAGGVSG